MRYQKNIHVGHCTLLILLALFSQALGADVSLEWNASASEGVTGYKIYYGLFTPTDELRAICQDETKYLRNYQSTQTVSNQLTTTVRNLTPGKLAFFAATAFNDQGAESGYSNEVCTELNGGAPATLEIKGQSVSVNWYGVVCLAVTNMKATANFRWQKIHDDGSAGEWHTIIASPEPGRTEHRAVISASQLEGAGYYRYMWMAEDADSNTSTGSTFKVDEDVSD